jgi:hypothetical protein
MRRPEAEVAAKYIPRFLACGLTGRELLGFDKEICLCIKIKRSVYNIHRQASAEMRKETN